jgi:signal transduction histidine kinase
MPTASGTALNEPGDEHERNVNMCPACRRGYAGVVAQPTTDLLSPLAVSALALIGSEATADELEARFAGAGSVLAPGIAASLLEDLAKLGLVRVARVIDQSPCYVPTSLGQQRLVSTALGDARPLLADLERLRTDLLSTIAHELRTPLTAIRTSAGLLLDPASEPTEEQRVTLLRTIERNAVRMQRITGDILELARFRAGHVALQLRRFDAVALAESAVASVAPLAAQVDQRFELTGPATGRPRVFGDHRRLEQALVNLVSNAHKFSPRGACIRVEVAAVGEDVEWRVSDDGPGIAPEDQHRLFERFFVARTDRGAAREGVGLGLPTALAIAQAHAGTIRVDSEPGRGSTFTLAVPAAGPGDEA